MDVYSSPPPVNYIEHIRASRSRFRHSIWRVCSFTTVVAGISLETLALADKEPKHALIGLGYTSIGLLNVRSEIKIIHAIDDDIARYNSVTTED